MPRLFSSHRPNVGGSVSPLSFPNLILYLDSRLGLDALAHDDPVATWPDQSGNGYDAITVTAGQRPRYQKTSNLSPKGQPLVRWDGIDDYLNSGTINPYPDYSNGATFYWYGDLRTTTAPPAPFDCGVPWEDGTSQRPQLLTGLAGAADEYAFRDSASTKTFGFVTLGFQVVIWQFRPPATSEVFRNLVSLGTAGWTPSVTSPNTYNLGNVGSSNCPMNADQGAFLWYNAIHDAATRTKLVNQFFDKVFGL